MGLNCLNRRSRISRRSIFPDPSPWLSMFSTLCISLVHQNGTIYNYTDMTVHTENLLWVPRSQLKECRARVYSCYYIVTIYLYIHVIWPDCWVVSRTPDQWKIIGLVKLIYQSCPGMSGQNNEFSVAMVNRTVKYECTLNFCVVNVLAQQWNTAYAVVKETTAEGWDGCLMTAFAMFSAVSLELDSLTGC